MLDRRVLRGSLDPVAVARWFWARRDLLSQLTRREITVQYRESFLGFVWTFAQPLLSLAVYTFVFTVVFEPRFGDGDTSRYDFVLRLFCGLIVFNVFAETVGRAPNLVVAQPSYVKQVVFPLEVLPVAVLGSALFTLATGLAVLVPAVWLGRGTLSPTLWLFPVVLLPLTAMTLGVAWFLAAFGVFVRDAQQAVAVGLQLLFFSTPVLWVPENLPEDLRSWLALNPLAPIVDGARATLVDGTMPEPGPLLVSLLWGLLAFHVGLIWFRITRRGFSDVL